MSRGNPDNLRKAAHAKQAAALERAERGRRDLIKRGEPITFQAVASAAGVSKDFLYRTAELRSRISQLRDQQDTKAPRPPAPRREENGHQSISSVVRTLTTKLTAERAQHHRELSDLQNALAAAHGELLNLKRQAHGAPTRGGREVS